MSSKVNPLIDPFNYAKGFGKITFSDGVNLEVNVVVNLLYSGRIRGTIDFLTYNPHLLEYTKKSSIFTLSGKTEHEIGFHSDCCFLTNVRDNHFHSKAHGEFSSHKILFYPDSQQLKPTRQLRIDFMLLNVYRMLLIKFMTSSGSFIINQYENHEELEKWMSMYHIPMITSCGSLTFIPDGSKTIEEIIKIVTPDVQDFLKVTSLSQTTWHDWASIELMEQTDNTDMCQTIFTMWRSPKAKPPHYRQLAMAVNSREFIKNAWSGYSHDNDKYGFDYALEWYIESNSAALDVTKFVNATTCLELLISKFSQLIVKKQRTYVKNAKTLLDYWGISISDIKTSLEEIVKIRNAIIHRGLYFHDEDIEKAKKVLEAYEDLFQILTRIFLAMLKYDGEYYDPPRNRWIKFSDVCSKIGCPGFN